MVPGWCWRQELVFFSVPLGSKVWKWRWYQIHVQGGKAEASGSPRDAKTLSWQTSGCWRWLDGGQVPVDDVSEKGQRWIQKVLQTAPRSRTSVPLVAPKVGWLSTWEEERTTLADLILVFSPNTGTFVQIPDHPNSGPRSWYLYLVLMLDLGPDMCPLSGYWSLLQILVLYLFTGPWSFRLISFERFWNI